MFDQDQGAGADLDAIVERFGAVVDRLLAVNLTGATDDSLLAAMRGLQRHTNRLAAADHALIAEVQQRGMPGARAYRGVADLLVEVLRLDPRTAAGRVRAAAELGPRRALTGEPLEPIFPTVAAATATGAISPAHARIITSTIDALPAAVAADHDRAVETFLTDQAEQFDPRALRLIARRLHDTLDPDGTLATEADRTRRRDLSITTRPDGSAVVHGELDTICTEALLTVLDTLARPTPAHDTGEPDPRSAAQRRHDALRDAMLTLIRTNHLPDCGGISTTILLTMTPHQLAAATTTTTGTATTTAGTGAGPGRDSGTGAAGGLVLTGHGALISTRQAGTLLGDAQLLPITLSRQKRVEAYGDTHRLFTQNQRLAMAARDNGCSFPGCTIPPAWCQAAHITAYADAGPTTITNGTLLCGYHHREYDRLGWTCTMHNGQPHWTPPPWIDPTQTPRRNHAHNPADGAAFEADPKPDWDPVPM